MSTIRSLLVLLLSLLSLVACTNGSRMRSELAALQARNQADSLMNDDSLALVLTNYFDRYGTANEKMLAHYLLGRTYYDLDRQPEAIAAYQNAIDCADTTAQDCDYYILCRIHAQMGDLFYWQNLYQRQQEELGLSYRYALLAGDTIVALYNNCMRGNSYGEQNQNDSAIAILEYTMNQYIRLGHNDYASMCGAAMLGPLLAKNMSSKAHDYMKFYEMYSGLFDNQGDIVSGAEIYYYMKALYFIEVSCLDSAEYYLRKLQRTGNGWNEKLSAASGFCVLYEKKNNTDSLLRYIREASSLHDSLSASMESENILRFDKTYQYERLQNKVVKTTQEVLRARQFAWLFFTLFLLLAIASVYIYSMIKRKRKEEWIRYVKDQDELERMQTTVRELEEEKGRLQNVVMHNSEENERLTLAIIDAYREMDLLKSRIQKYEHRNVTRQREKEETTMQTLPVYLRLKSIADQPVTTPSDSDWQELKTAFDQTVPDFYSRLHRGSYILSDMEYRICMLIWLRFSPSDISNLISMSKAYVSVVRKKLLREIYGIDGLPKELDAKIMRIC